MTQPIVNLNKIDLSYGRDVVLQQVDLQVEHAQTVCLCGPSGCGKTTLLNVIAGIAQPSSGTVSVHAERIAFVFQDDRLIPWRSIVDNVTIPLDNGRISTAEARERAMQCLDAVDLLDAADMVPAELSGGMLRRANLARALAVEPDLLLCDEPFAFLDPDAVQLARQCIARLRDEQNTTLIIVSHVEQHVAPLKPEIIHVSGTGPLTFSFP